MVFTVPLSLHGTHKECKEAARRVQCASGKSSRIRVLSLPVGGGRVVDDDALLHIPPKPLKVLDKVAKGR